VLPAVTEVEDVLEALSDLQARGSDRFGRLVKFPFGSELVGIGHPDPPAVGQTELVEVRGPIARTSNR